MTAQEFLQVSAVTLVVAGGLSVLIGNVYYVIRSKNSKINKEELEHLRIEISTCEAKHQDSEKSISHLQGQIDVLQNIPLRDINNDISSIRESNQKILTTLQSSVVTLKKHPETGIKERKTVASKLSEA